MELECVGSGERRFKFINQTVNETSHQDSAAGPTTSSSSSSLLLPSSLPSSSSSFAAVEVRPRPSSTQPSLLLHRPASQTSRIASQYVSRLAVTDARYDIICYGVFLCYIPGRLGNCEVLDLAVDTFSTACAVLHSNEVPVAALVKHGKTLTALRGFLRDPPRHLHAELLCAVYITMLNEASSVLSLYRSCSSMFGVLC